MPWRLRESCGPAGPPGQVGHGCPRCHAGDRNRVDPLTSAGGVGFFTREVQVAVVARLVVEEEAVLEDGDGEGLGRDEQHVEQCVKGDERRDGPPRIAIAAGQAQQRDGVEHLAQRREPDRRTGDRETDDDGRAAPETSIVHPPAVYTSIKLTRSKSPIIIAAAVVGVVRIASAPRGYWQAEEIRIAGRLLTSDGEGSPLLVALAVVAVATDYRFKQLRAEAQTEAEKFELLLEAVAPGRAVQTTRDVFSMLTASPMDIDSGSRVVVRAVRLRRG